MMPEPRFPIWKWLLALLVSATLVITTQVLVSPRSSSTPTPTLPDLRDHVWDGCAVGAPTAQSLGDRRVLILHDRGGEALNAGVVHATLMANIASHFGAVSVKEARDYERGDMLEHDGLIYLGSRYGEKLPAAFLTDVRRGERPVLWLKQNIHQLYPRERFRREFGWVWNSFDDPATAFQVEYKNQQFYSSGVGNGLTLIDRRMDERRAAVLATASLPGSRRSPWAVRSQNLTYVGDLPFGSDQTRDSSLVVADLLHDLLPGSAAEVEERRAALVRLEDIGPMSDPEQLRQAARALSSRHIPFSIAVYPLYVGPITAEGQKVVRLADRPEVVRAIVEMLDAGGTLVLHGYSHQFGDLRNPKTGESGTDFEFFLAHLDEDGSVVYDGPVPGDSTDWAKQRIQTALADLQALGLPRSEMFNVPHYAASPADYQAINELFQARYDRGQYFAPSWKPPTPANEHMVSQSAPFLIRDAHGSLVVPENLGFVSDPSPAAVGADTEGDILEGARAMLAVRDSVASFFYHPFLGTSNLIAIVDQMRGMGYEFISPCEL